ncbi:DUF6714 family protein [Lysobacter silvisoli]|uniref:DUF4375 domain-containing protein n=1 Tax=Lysobacter silvisoli TaxID=2293254 RepID=A0A371K4W6_9GAMM|nr:DUF6714 family protein [Lysobacter silvisoli]RDZ28955.1 hypothetical protein DX914_07595 [Lysobacter silvisoli]
MSISVLELFAAFNGLPDRPAMSLRAGNAEDDYEAHPDYDAEIDRLTPEYLETYHWGIGYLDAESWRYYLPHLLAHALQSLARPGSMVVQSLLYYLRPPDRDPPRFGALTPAQSQAVIAVLDELAFAHESVWQDDAMLALEEYWAPGARYR